jgi:molybdopterin-guanine dinucleotide biosynthesis protein A
MLGLLSAAGASRVLVSGDRPGRRGIPDAWSGRGPVAGLASALAACPEGPAVVVPVDLPLLDTPRLSRLVAALAEAPAAHFSGHPLPCAVRVDDAIRAATRAMVEASPDGPSMRAWLAEAGAIALDPGAGADLRPCNTPADYAALAP